MKKAIVYFTLIVGLVACEKEPRFANDGFLFQTAPEQVEGPVGPQGPPGIPGHPGIEGSQGPPGEPAILEYVMLGELGECVHYTVDGVEFSADLEAGGNGACIFEGHECERQYAIARLHKSNQNVAIYRRFVFLWDGVALGLINFPVVSTLEGEEDESEM